MSTRKLSMSMSVSDPDDPEFDYALRWGYDGWLVHHGSHLAGTVVPVEEGGYVVAAAPESWWQVHSLLSDCVQIGAAPDVGAAVALIHDHHQEADR